MEQTRISIEIANQQSQLVVEHAFLRQAIEDVLTHEGIVHADISVALVDDRAIWEVNKRHLEHDYPTDVISFLLDRDGERLEGEVIASTDTAIREAVKYQWDARFELLLYLVHGTLHLVGYDDLDPENATVMRQRESFHLTRLIGRAAPATRTAS